MSGRAETYDDLPYGSRAVRESHPAHLAAVARLFGVEAPAPETARVLELGCAEGGNLLPMAVGAPSATFLGIDLSAQQVEAGEARRSALGLANAALHVADVATFDPGTAPFDYVVAHGLWSWVPEPVAEALLDLVARVLSPRGVAYVSYNTYPGWHLRGLVRDLLLRDPRAGADPAGRVARARELLTFAATNARDRSPAYGEVLRDTLAQFSRHDDARLFHEWLEENNRPSWFRDSAAGAARHGLEPLADARLAAMPMGRVKPEVDDLLSSRAEGRLEKEELLDVLRNRCSVRRSSSARRGPAATNPTRRPSTASSSRRSSSPSPATGRGRPSGAPPARSRPTTRGSSPPSAPSRRPRRAPCR